MAKHNVFLERERDENFPWNIEGIAGDTVFEINAWIELEARASMVFDHVFKREMPIQGLEMIGKAVIGPAKIVTLVLETGAEIPFAGDEKTMVVAEIVVKRLAITEFCLVKVAVEGIGRFVCEKIV